jgi:hypothetical protein
MARAKGLNNDTWLDTRKHMSWFLFLFQEHDSGQSFCRRVLDAGKQSCAATRAYLADECEHVARDVAFREASSGVREEIVPFSLERVVFCPIAQAGVVPSDVGLSQVRVQSTAPLA